PHQAPSAVPTALLAAPFPNPPPGPVPRARLPATTSTLESRDSPVQAHVFGSRQRAPATCVPARRVLARDTSRPWFASAAPAPADPGLILFRSARSSCRESPAP